jgi:DNA-binding response OmpR family regulator
VFHASDKDDRIALAIEQLGQKAMNEMPVQLRKMAIDLIPLRAVDSVGLTALRGLLDLTRREFAVLHALMLNAGRVLSRARLEEALYAWGDEIESNAVEVHVHHLRRKLYPELIVTVRGVGYLIPARPAR